MRARLKNAGSIAVVVALVLLACPGTSEPLVITEEASSPVPYSRDSIARGKVLYARYCAECHDPDGKGQIDVIADATDLTSPQLWYNGTERDEVLGSIRDGAGISMPAFKKDFSEEQLWDLVNFTQSLWPESKRPPLHEE